MITLTMTRCVIYTEGAVLTDENGNEVGVITSGGPSPCLKQNIAMGYINKPHNKVCRSRLSLDFRKVGHVLKSAKSTARVGGYGCSSYIYMKETTPYPRQGRIVLPRPYTVASAFQLRKVSDVRINIASAAKHKAAGCRAEAQPRGGGDQDAIRPDALLQTRAVA
jgi:hypothetical protein